MSLTKQRRSTKTSSESIQTMWTVSMAGLNKSVLCDFLFIICVYVSASVKRKTPRKRTAMEKRIAHARTFLKEQCQVKDQCN